MKNILIIRDNLLKTERKMKVGFRCLIIYILLFIFYYLLLKYLNTVYIMLDSMYVDYVYIHRIVSYTGFMECK